MSRHSVSSFFRMIRVTVVFGDRYVLVTFQVTIWQQSSVHSLFCCVYSKRVQLIINSQDLYYCFVGYFSNKWLFYYYVTRTVLACLASHKLNPTDCTLTLVSDGCLCLLPGFLACPSQSRHLWSVPPRCCLACWQFMEFFHPSCFLVWPSRVSFLPHVLSVCSSL